MSVTGAWPWVPAHINGEQGVLFTTAGHPVGALYPDPLDGRTRHLRFQAAPGHRAGPPSRRPGRQTVAPRYRRPGICSKIRLVRVCATAGWVVRWSTTKSRSPSGPATPTCRR